MKNSAFTLVELLLALSIVGIIAALTVPGIIGDTISKTSSATLKATVEQTSNALRQAMLDQNVRDIADLEFVNNGTDAENNLAFFKKRFEVSKQCGANRGDCFADDYLNSNGQSISDVNHFEYDSFVTLTNGASVALHRTSDANNEAYLLVDVNGKKVPNVSGEDLFTFLINQDGTIGETVSSSDIADVRSKCLRNREDSTRFCSQLVMAKDWNIASYKK